MNTTAIFRTHYYAKVEADKIIADDTALVSFVNGGLEVAFQCANQRHDEIQAKASALRLVFPALQVVNKRTRKRGIWPYISLPLYSCSNQHGHPSFTGQPADCSGNCDTCHCNA